MSLPAISAYQFHGNSVRDWGIALAVLVVTFGVLLLARRIASRRLTTLAERTDTRLDDLGADLLRRTHGFFLLAAAAGVATLAVTLTDTDARAARTAGELVLLLQAAIWGNGLIAFWIRQVTERRDADAGLRTTMAALNYVARGALWVILLLLALDTLGVPITTLVTTLGVGGVAVALAVQNILGDLFAALSIVLDKPFVVGDAIDVGGDFVGTVQHVGLKSTRIRSIAGEMIVISNGDLLKSRIRNFRGQTERRVVFRLGLDRGTPSAVLAGVPAMLREVVEAQPFTRFDRSHFRGIGDVALDFETVYYMTDANYTLYMDAQQAINLEVLRRFAAAGIALAHPTRTVVVAERDGRRDARPAVAQ